MRSHFLGIIATLAVSSQAAAAGQRDHCFTYGPQSSIEKQELCYDSKESCKASQTAHRKLLDRTCFAISIDNVPGTGYSCHASVEECESSKADVRNQGDGFCTFAGFPTRLFCKPTAEGCQQILSAVEKLPQYCFRYGARPWQESCANDLKTCVDRRHEYEIGVPAGTAPMPLTGCVQKAGIVMSACLKASGVRLSACQRLEQNLVTECKSLAIPPANDSGIAPSPRAPETPATKKKAF